jgi:hypothetical protein
MTYAVDKPGAGVTVYVNGSAAPTSKDLGLPTAPVNVTNEDPALFSFMATDSIVAATLPVFLNVTIIDV